MIIGLEPPLLPWVADEKKVVITFLMQAHALVTDQYRTQISHNTTAFGIYF
jgi:hypothetical protein